MDFSPWDLVTILILVALEGLLSVDNALVLAVMVLPLPEEQRPRALRYGIIGAFVLRTIAVLLAVILVKQTWIMLVGGLYLLYLPVKHFSERRDEEPPQPPDTTPRPIPLPGDPEGTADALPAAPAAPTAPARAAHGPAVRGAAVGFLGLSAFWSTVVKLEMVDLVFAVDSILAALGVTKKTWVIIIGGILGLVMMRLLVIPVLSLVKRYPKLVDGAYVVVAWVGIKLTWEFLHKTHLVPFGIDDRVAVGVVLLLFTGCFLYARGHPNENPELQEATADAEALLGGRPKARRAEPAPAAETLAAPSAAAEGVPDGPPAEAPPGGPEPGGPEPGVPEPGPGVPAGDGREPGVR